MKSLGQVAFEQYSEAKGGRAFNDTPIPQWDELSGEVAQAWEAAAKEVKQCVLDRIPVINDWRHTQLDERQRKEVQFAEVYAKDFNHGTVGHNTMLVVARLAALLDETLRTPQVRRDDAEDKPKKGKA